MSKFAIFAAASLVWLPSGWSADQTKPDSPKRLEAKTQVMRDGGSRHITIPAHGDRPACEVYVDWAGNSKTLGELFLAKNFEEDREGKQLTWEQANKLLKQLEQVLIAHYGAAELLEIVLNPIEPGAHLSEEEFGERTVKDPGFADRLEARYLMDEIIAYRTKHGPLLKRK